MGMVRMEAPRAMWGGEADLWLLLFSFDFLFILVISIFPHILLFSLD